MTGVSRLASSSTSSACDGVTLINDIGSMVFSVDSDDTSGKLRVSSGMYEYLDVSLSIISDRSAMFARKFSVGWNFTNSLPE
jgi:hypothetical protein